jgi:hypothetical protein
VVAVVVVVGSLVQDDPIKDNPEQPGSHKEPRVKAKVLVTEPVVVVVVVDKIVVLAGL